MTGHIANKYRLPAAVVWAVTHDRYDPGDGDISCTTLIAPAQQFQMRKMSVSNGDDKFFTDREGKIITYSDLTEEDASERIWSMIGSAVHYILENACIAMQDAGEWTEAMIAERRFYHVVDGKKISAQIDLLDENNDLNDFKVTSVWSIKSALEEGKDEWTAQLNIQNYLMCHNGIEPRNLYITAIARDWNKSNRMRDPKYPPRAVRVRIPKWSLEQTEAYIQGRLNVFYAPYNALCSPKETWESQTKHALMKTGRASAIRLLNTEHEALLFAHEKGHADVVEKLPVLKKGFYLEVRWGERKRCDNYCDMMPFCEQYKDWIKSQEKIEE